MKEIYTIIYENINTFINQNNNIIILILIIILITTVFYLIKLSFHAKNIKKQEKKIRQIYNTRANMIPSIYEVTIWTFNKHSEIFQDILKYRKLELYKYYVQEFTDNMDNDFAKLIHIENLILHELKFIFKVSNKHNKLCKKWNFLYIRDLLINKNSELIAELIIHKKRIKKFNNFLNYKKYTILWLLIPIYKKTEL